MKDIRCSLKVLLLEPSLKLKGFSSRDTRDMGLILGSGRSPRVGNGNLLQYSSLENFMDRGAWRNIVHWVTKSQKHNWVTKHIACSILYLQLYLTSNFSNSLSFCGFFFFHPMRNCVCVSVWVDVCTHFCETFPLISLLKSYSSRNLLNMCIF